MKGKMQWPGYPKKMFKFNNAKVNISNGYRYTILHAVAKFLWKYMMDAKNGKMVRLWCPLSCLLPFDQRPFHAAMG
jgi:hypothetical protein